MAEETEKMSGQEQIKPLTTANSVTSEGILVKPREDTKIYATKGSKHLGDEGTEHIVHRALAEKLVAKGAATLDAPKKKGKDE